MFFIFTEESPIDRTSKHLKEIKEEVSLIVTETDLLDQMFIAGGAIRSLLIGDKVSDYDIFFKTQEALEKFVAHMEYRQYEYKSNNSIGLFSSTGKHLQFIIVTSGSPESVVGEFDFTCNQSFYNFSEELLNVHTDSYSRNLRINPNARNTMGTFLRIGKFLRKGYNYPPREDMVMLGIKMTQHEPITTYTDLDESSKMNFIEKEMDKVNDLITLDEKWNLIKVRPTRVGSAGGG